MNKKLIVFTTIAIIVVVGATALKFLRPVPIPEKPGEYVGSPERKMSELSPREVFLRVNGREYRRRDFDVAVSFQDKLLRMCAGDPLTGPNKAAEEKSVFSYPRTLSEILRRELLRQFAAKHNIFPTKEDYAAYTPQLTKTLRRQGKSLEEIAAEFGNAEGKMFLEYTADDAIAPRLREVIDTEGKLDITDDDVLNISNRIARFQANAAASNEVQRATLAKAAEELAAGADFVEVAKKYSISPEDARVWTDGFLDELDDVADFRTWVRSAKEGSVSPVLELEDGVAIVKVAKKELETLGQGEIRLPQDIYTLVRIVRPFYESPPDMDRAEIVENLIKFRSMDLQKKLGDEIMASAVIEWPCGTNLFEKVTKK